MESLWQDLRYAVRRLVKSPGFTIVAVLTLALGIGANAVVFTLANTVLFKGFPFDRNDRIMYMGNRNVTRNDRFGNVSYPDFRDWRGSAKSFVGIAAATGLQANLTDDQGLPETHRGALVTTNLFGLIGQKPVMGRDFVSSDEVTGAQAVAILSYGLWQRRSGKDTSVIGRTIRLNGAPTIVIGIMAPAMTFPFGPWPAMRRPCGPRGPGTWASATRAPGPCA